VLAIPLAVTLDAAVLPSPIAAADAAWNRRDDGHDGSRANARPIGEAVALYGKAATAPDSVEARWKLARALFFEARFTGLDRDASRALLEKARTAGEEAIAILRKRGTSANDRDAAPAYFWAAVAWGEWGRLVPKLKAGRAGTAAKIRDYATKLIALDSAFEDGGGYRILGRLHDRAPRLPIFTPWVSRAEALRNLRLAVRTAPKNFVNRHFLAEALAGGDGAERDEATKIEKELVADAPSPGHLVEDLAIQDEAKRNLAAWSRRS
jgi:tetratricopeptide (TPR) repeat protein